MKLEKMNQVSVTEFMSKSKEEMYDMAVEMVEKYNRLVDICNDSAKRIADLVIERDNLVERHKVYTSALNKDLADKAAKIELLEKEIEGRKEGYTALKELMDTKYISIDEHNNIVDQLNKEIERLNRYSANVDKVNNDLVTKVTLLENENKILGEKIRRQKENLDGLNKTLEIRTDQLRATESKVDELWKRIKELEEELTRAWKNKYTCLNKGDDHGRAGFKKYIEWLIEEEERAVPERFKERLNEEITEIFEEEETEVKGNGRTSSGRYPWGAKVNDIPCGEDAIE